MANPFITSATNQGALKSTLNAVATAAGTFTSLFNTTTKSVGMLDRMVTKASNQQSMQHRKDERQFVKNLVRQAASEDAEADMKVVEFRKLSEEHASLFDKAHNEYENLFATELGLPTSTSPEA